MAAVQAEDIHASFLFVGDLNGHHQEWLCSITTNHHGGVAFDLQLSPFVIISLSAQADQPMHVMEHLT